MKAARTEPGFFDLAVVFGAAGAGLAYEILLLRVFSYSQWHHFASLAVSLALLGFGAAGTALALLGDRAARGGDRFFLASLWAAGAGMAAAFLLPHRVQIRPLFAVWDARELAKLLLIDLVSFFPFFGLALAIGQVFIRWPKATARLYSANLAGSGIGALAACLLLSKVFLETALLLAPTALFILAAAWCLALRRRRASAAFAAAALLLGGWIGAGLPRLPLSDFKSLARLLDLPDAKILKEEPGLRAQLSLVRSDSIRVAPGLSLRWTETVASQDALVLDADRLIPLPRAGSEERLGHLAASLGELPFLLRPDGPVAVLGASAWWGSLRARGRPGVWVEPDRRVIDAFLARGYPEGLTALPEDPRRFLERTEERFALIFFESAASAKDAASEDYLLTVEAFSKALDRLAPGGLIALPMSLSNPPRRMPRLLAMAAAALRGAGLEPCWNHCALLRSMQEGMLLISNRPLEAEDAALARSFAKKWSFDLAALPDLPREEANQRHLLPSPVFYDTARALLAGEGEVPGEASWYSLKPASDLKPYFWRSMRWEKLPALWHEQGARALVWLDWSLLILAAKLLAVTALGALLILLPLLKLPRRRAAPSRLSVFLYFTCLGMGFLLLEIALFQRGILFLGDPVLSASLVFALFLLAAGLGSRRTPALARPGTGLALFAPVLGFAALAALLLFFAEQWVIRLPGAWRFIALAAACVPLAWFMGRPFPWGLRRLDATRPLIPWAWGINGFASVLAAPLASMISIHLGQPATWISGAACYAAAWAIAAKWFTRNRETG